MELIDLKGPQVVAQPAQPYAMQEGRVIMPEPKVAVGKGFDWDSFGKAFAELGTQVVQAVHEKDNADKENLLQKLSIDTDAKVSEALDNGDYGAWQVAVDEYKKGATQITGYDFDAVPAGKLPQQLMERTRSNFYKWSDQKTGAERDAKFSAMSDKVETLSTEMGIKISAAFDNGRFDEADRLTREFQEKVNTMLGISGKDDQPIGKIRSSILSRARNDITKWTASKGVAQQKYLGSAELSSLDTIAARFEKNVSGDITTDARLALQTEYKSALERIHKEKLGVSLFDDIDVTKTPLTEQQMAIRARLQHHWNNAMDVVSAAERANKKPDKLEEVNNLAQNRIATAGMYLARAKSAHDSAVALKEAGQFDEAAKAEAHVVSLVNAADEAKKDAMHMFGAVIDTNQGGANKPMQIIDWNSDEGMAMLEGVIKPTLFDNITRFNSARSEFDNTQLKGVLAVRKELGDQAKKAQFAAVDVHVAEARGVIEKMEAKSKEPGNSKFKYAFQRVAQEKFEELKARLLGELDKLDSSGYFAKVFAGQSKVVSTVDTLRDPTLLLLPPELASQRYMQAVLTSPKFNLDTMRAYVPLVSVADQQVWAHVITELEQVQSKLNALQGTDGKKKTQKDYVRMLQMEQSNQFVDWQGDDMNNTVIEAFAMAGVNLVDQNGNVLGWKDLSQQLKEKNPQAYIPWRLITQSPVFQSFMLEAMNNEDPNWAEKNLGTLMTGPEETGSTWMDIENTNRHRADIPNNNPNMDALQEMIAGKWRSRETTLIAMSLLLPKENRDGLAKFVSNHEPRTTDPVELSQWQAFKADYLGVLDSYDSDLQKVSTQPDRTLSVFDHVRTKVTQTLNSESKAQLDNYRNVAGTLNDDVTFTRSSSNDQMSQEKKAAFDMHRTVRDISSGLKFLDRGLDAMFTVKGTANFPLARKTVDVMIADELLKYRQNPTDGGNEKELVTQRVQEKLNDLEFDASKSTFKRKNVEQKLTYQTVQLPLIMASQTGVGGSMPTEDLVLEAPGNFTALSQVPQADQKVYDNLRKDYGDTVAFAVASSNVDRMEAGNKVDNTLKAAAILKTILPDEASPMHIMAAQAALKTVMLGVDPTKHSAEIAVEYNKHLSRIRKQEGITVEERNMRGSFNNQLPTMIYRTDRGVEIASFQPTQDTLNQDLSETPFYKDKVSKMDFDALDKAYWGIPISDTKSRNNLIIAWMTSHPGQEVVMPRVKQQYSWFTGEFSFENGQTVEWKYMWKKFPNGRRYIYKSPITSAYHEDRVVDSDYYYSNSSKEEFKGRLIYQEPLK